MIRALSLRLGAAVEQGSSRTLAAASQQWPAALLDCSASHGAATAGLLQQGAPAGQQQQLASRGFASLAWRPLSPIQQYLTQQQQQQQHGCLISPAQQLPRQAAAAPAAWLLPQQQQQQLLPLGARSFVLMPRRIKYRKAHKSMGFNETICPNNRQLAFGLYGIRAMEHCRIPARTLEAVRRTLRRTVKKSTMLWIRVTPSVPVTSKPAEVRMGKGKGTLDYWAAPIRPGQILFEMDRCSKAAAQEAMRSIQAKMPIKIGFVEWN